MRKPNPTRFTGLGKRKPDELKMKGFSAPLPDEILVEEKKETSESTDVRTDERTYQRTKTQRDKRTKIRHAFDIFEDQLRSLHTLQLEAVREGKTKPNLGEMVQQAIDIFLTNKKEKGR